ncbi:MAG: RagB/SusD family nutrient uptake outer membrane protein [bacterium]
MKKVSRQPLLLGTAVILGVGSLYGCKDFLAEAAAPQGTLNESTLSNKAGVEGTLIATYRGLDVTNSNGGIGSAASNWVWGSVTSDDAYKGSESSDATPVNDIEAYHWGTADAESWSKDKWKADFEGIVRANSTIRLLKSVAKDQPTAISAIDQKGIEGEAIFLRAHYHFDLWKIYGNIPYFRETDLDPRKANSPSATVITEILKDLDAAIALLPATPRNGNIGRATVWTAKAYKGRALMYAKQFPAALTLLRDIRANGPFKLETSYDKVWSGFQDYANGPETIFAYQASANDGEPNGNNANYGERLNFPHSGSPFGCCGFHQPTQNLVNYFATDANGLPIALSDPANWNASNANFSAQEATKAGAKTVDPRLDFTVGRDDTPYKDWGLHKPDWIRSPAFSGTYSPKKNIHEKSSGAQSSVGWVNTQLNSVNIHILRYADVLLLLAEAEVEAGSLENARTIVNEIRDRAAVKVQGTGADRATIAVPINDPSITWAKYKISPYATPWTNQAQARDAVRAERRLELAMEGQRFFDLRRWDIAVTTINGYLKGVGGGAEASRRVQLGAAETFGTRHALFPIPSQEIQLSKSADGSGGLTQNPGW